MTLQAQFNKKKHKRIAPLSVRLTEEEIERLNHDSQGYASRNDYIKERLFNQRRQQVRKAQAKDREALSKILGLLGASRLANNLNQLAYKANVDTFLFTPEVKQQLDEAYEAIMQMRQLLLQALGYRKV
jgi:hypothetical protein